MASSLRGAVRVRERSAQAQGARAVHVRGDADPESSARAAEAAAVDADATAAVAPAAELARVREELVALRARHTALVGEQTDLLAVVCHELRTPITVITGFARLLASERFGELNPKQAHFVDECRKACARLDAFVEDLLRAARDERAADACALEDASLVALFRDVLTYLEPVLADARVAVALRVDPDAEWARFDRARLEQVVVNLLGNALRHAGEGGEVRVRARRVAADCAAADAADGTGPSAAPHAIEVSVEDDGPGVAPEDRERIFEPWVRVGGSAAASAPAERTAARERTGRGLGLGLAICRRIVEGHGGRLALRSEPGAGACFTFTLPAALPKEP